MSSLILGEAAAAYTAILLLNKSRALQNNRSTDRASPQDRPKAYKVEL